MALSSTEAEYICLSSGASSILWYRSLLEEIGFNQEKATIITQDNESTIRIAESKKQAPGVKNISSPNPNISIRHHFIRDRIQSKEIVLKSISTKDMLADIFTKNLPFPRFSDLRYKIGVSSN